MGKALDFYKVYSEASTANPPASIIEASMKYLSDDFKNYDKDGNVTMNKEAYIGMSQLLLSAFEDLKTIYGDSREEGDTVIQDYHFEGTHTGELDLSAMGIGVIPASGKYIVWPDSTIAIKVRGDKIVSIRPYGDSGDVRDFFAVLGVEMPSA